MRQTPEDASPKSATPRTAPAERAPVVLVADASRRDASQCAGFLTRAGYAPRVVQGPAEAATLLGGGATGGDLLLLDLGLPGEGGLGALLASRDNPGGTPWIAMAAPDAIDLAVEATRRGAFDFLVRPIDETRLLAAAAAALRARSGPDAPGAEPGAHPATARLIGASTAMRNLRRRVTQLAQSNAPVFITGESGVGKELCAEAIHAASARRDGPFNAINCGAIPGELLESVMFGHVKGAFTGAHADAVGAVRAAQGGTLFLDELCEMAPELQVKMLRFLESGAVTPVGAARARPVDVRIVCASNRDPQEEMAEGRLRRDLFYRLYVLPLEAPPLRARGNDAALLAELFLRRFGEEEGKSFTGFAPEALARISCARWPGNVRELINAVRHVAVFGQGGLAGVDLLPDMALLPPPEPPPARPLGAGDMGHGGVYGTGARTAARDGASARPDAPRSAPASGAHDPDPTPHDAQPRPATPDAGLPRGASQVARARDARDASNALDPGLLGAPPAAIRAGENEADDEAQRQLSAQNELRARRAAADKLVGLTLLQAERLIIEAAIDACGGSLPSAARLLRVSPSTLYRKRDSWR